MSDSSSFTPQSTEDGSFTFFSTQFGECFHSHTGAYTEAQKKFVEPTELLQKAKTAKRLRLLDICYGLGYNTAAALEAIWSVNPECYVEVIGLEIDLIVPKSAIAHQLLQPWNAPIPKLLETLVTTTQSVQTERLSARLLLGDARLTIQQIKQSNFRADAIFLDPFSPPVCPQLWTVEFLQLVADCCAKTGRLATYSCAAAVRAALIAVGFQIGQVPDLGQRPGTIASFSAADLPPLSARSQEHLQTRAAVPYHDPQLCDEAKVIVQRRHQHQQISPLEPSSHWKRRWLNHWRDRMKEEESRMK
jgi:tRNA U34 5-methylaminomethyl-2-thiouridine-forming methyltransferase MnmC